MFAVAKQAPAPLEPNTANQAAPGDLPVVHLEDKGEHLDAFLRWLHPDWLRDALANACEGH